MYFSCIFKVLIAHSTLEKVIIHYRYEENKTKISKQKIAYKIKKFRIHSYLTRRYWRHWKFNENVQRQNRHRHEGSQRLRFKSKKIFSVRSVVICTVFIISFFFICYWYIHLEARNGSDVYTRWGNKICASNAEFFFRWIRVKTFWIHMELFYWQTIIFVLLYNNTLSYRNIYKKYRW